MTATLRTRRVRSGEVELHVVESGEPGRPPVLLVHGFPDDHQVYDRVMDDLAHDFHVASFDMRGVGASTAPARSTGYRIERILPDLTAVIDAVFGPGATVHLVGHDWGSVLGFSYICDSVGRTRVRSFTSVSGPHVRLMLDSVLAGGDGGSPGARLRQLLSSWYIFALHTPRLPEALIEAFGPRMYRNALERGGASPDDPYLAVSREEAIARMLRPIALYRQNALRPPPRPAPASITTPLLVLVPERDPFVRPSVHAALPAYATSVELRPVDASHWLPRSHPELLAAAVREHANRVDATRANEEGERWR